MEKNIKEKIYINKIVPIIIYLVYIMFSLFIIITYDKKEIIIFFAGLVFFIVGFHLAISKIGKGIGGLFMIAPGAEGLLLMVYTFINEKVDKTLLSEYNSNLIVYIIIIAITFVIALLLTLDYSINDKLKKKKYIKLVLQILYIIGLLLTALIPILNF